MISVVELARYLQGAWQLVKRDPSGFAAFDNTPEAAWSSFRAMIVSIAPALIIYPIYLSGHDITTNAISAVVLSVEFYIIGWFAFPLVLLYVARQFDCERYVCRTIGAWNWAVLLQLVPLLAMALLSAVVGPSAFLVLLSLAVTVLILVYKWYILRYGLEIESGLATALVIFDLVLNVILNQIWLAML